MKNLNSYEINKLHGQELRKGKVPIDIFIDKESTFEYMGNLMADTIKDNNKLGKKTLFIVPLGPIGQYKYFVKRVNKEKISLKDTTFINMDEYMVDEKTLIDPNHPLSFRKIMNELCYSQIDKDLIMDESQRIFPSLDNADYIDEVIEKHNGVDICFGGIGITGHIAFNEPEDNVDPKEFVNSRTRVIKIKEATLVVNSMDEYDGAYYLMPQYAITIGLKEILNSKKVRLFCFRQWHKSVVKRASFGEITTQFPATFLQKHKDARIGISEEVAE